MIQKVKAYLIKRREEREEHKKVVLKNRKELKENPTKWIKEEILIPTFSYWKERPFHAIFTFVFYGLIMYLLFGGIQAVNNDMIYCDASIDEFDGKLMFTYNRFVKYYNDKAMEMQNTSTYDSYWDRKQKVMEFNEEYSMLCDYNITKWREEDITYRMKTIGEGLWMILLKRG